MYRREKPIILKGSSSSLCNNLAVLVMADKRQISYAVVHKYAVNVVTASTDGSSVTARQVVCKEPSASLGNPFLMEAKWVQAASRCIMVLTTQRGIQMFEQDGSAMIYWHGLNDGSDNSSSNFARGVVAVGDCVCIGTESGKILVFGIPPKGTNVTLKNTLKGHSSPICDLSVEGNVMASSDNSGNILIWNFSGSDAKQMVSIAGSGSPCNSVRLWKGTVVAGYGSGHLRVFNAVSGKIGAEVTAHARSINAVDVAPEKGLVLSISDDSFMRVWKVTPGNVPQLEYQHSENVTDLQLVGGKFVDPQGRALCLTGYDHNEIIFFVKA
ncbi:WD repeat domain 54-like [Babylonia areolata]|uniref:WD repeat domain 54-like n=1 Tax=Babylonia areolata TaxID=304850 RepID=UPI003FD1D1CD